MSWTWIALLALVSTCIAAVGRVSITAGCQFCGRSGIPGVYGCDGVPAPRFPWTLICSKEVSMSNTKQSDSGPRFSRTQGSCASPALEGPGNTLQHRGEWSRLRQAAKMDLPGDLRLRPGRSQASSRTATVICLSSTARAA